jgi:hypothetical protein
MPTESSLGREAASAARRRPRLIGRRVSPAPGKKAVLDSGGMTSDVVDLSMSENVSDRVFGTSREVAVGTGDTGAARSFGVP